jgi:hypothetical protein
MNALPSLFARSIIALTAGTLMWAKQLAAPNKPGPSTSAKIALSKKLDDPRKLSKSDVRAAKKAWGKDSEKMLEILRDSED